MSSGRLPRSSLRASNDPAPAIFSKADRERLKKSSKGLLASLRERLKPMRDWTQNATTQADVKMFILDDLWQSLPRPPFTGEETEDLATPVHNYVWQRRVSGVGLAAL